MKVSIHRASGKYHLKSVNEEGLSVETDASPAMGGDNAGVRPMQMVLMALGSCSAIDVISILEKQKQTLADIKIDIQAEREPDKEPSLFTDIHIHFHLYGDLSDKKAARAVNLSMDTYCSVAQILKKSANITFEYTIHK